MAQYLNYSKGKAYKITSEERLLELESEAIQFIEDFIKTSPRNVIAFSGGKDSIVASYIAKNLGVVDAINDSSFMFTRCKKETAQIAELFGLRLKTKANLDFNWLKKNPQYCQPPMKLQPSLYGKRQQKTVKSYAKKNGFTGVLYGRRKQENNVRSGLYSLANGQWQCHPLINWTTNDIWSYIDSRKLPSPHLYTHEIGMKEGYTSYLLPPEHFGGNVWKAIYDYEPEVVYKFAEFFPPAKAYLDLIK